MSEWYRLRTGYPEKDNYTSELYVETSSCENESDSYNLFKSSFSPIQASRKLDFSETDNEDSSPAPAPISPPYKRVRALRLFDSPLTPKTLLKKCSTPSHNAPRLRRYQPKLSVSAADMQAVSSNHLHPGIDDSSLAPCNSGVNINPFTPEALKKKKRSLSNTPNTSDTMEAPAKRIRESNISRYNVEFVDLGVIGVGQFGRVSKCVNRMDGCVYALKRSLQPVAGSAAERAALTEVYAHAVLAHHSRIVRYYSAWAEDDHMIIQNEYCDGGSLQQMLEENGPLPESELLVLLAHVADGLAHIHSLHLVHMDVKPANIFICSEEGASSGDSDDDFDEEDVPLRRLRRVYKIGDLGHVTCLGSPQVEEGDCRYIPREVLQEDFTHLTKADIFAFGLTLFEAAGGGPLPKNGQLWHDIREEKLPYLSNMSREFNMLLKKMVHPDPLCRPSASRLKRHPLLYPAGNKSKSDMRRELAAAKLKIELLERKIQDAARCLKSMTPKMATTDSAKFRTRSSKLNQKRV